MLKCLNIVASICCGYPVLETLIPFLNCFMSSTDSPSVMCVDSVPVGTDHLVTVYSSTLGDNTNTFSFTCFVSYNLLNIE